MLARSFYSYDSNGILYSVKYTLTDTSDLMTYYFTHNSRGDIIGIYNGAGDLRARYEYDAWGNVTSITDANGAEITSATHIGNLNPFRYRGYYQDSESGFYYLMSRYYDPVTHRFINADGYFQSGSSILDCNMHAYCANNPINNSDPTGEHAKNTTCGDPTCFQCRPDYKKFVEEHQDFIKKSNSVDPWKESRKNQEQFSNAFGTASNGLSTIRGVTYTIAGYGAVTAASAAGVSFLGAAPSTVCSIVSHSTNPYLQDWQKGTLIGIDVFCLAAAVGFAALSICCPIAGIMFSVGITMLSYGVTTEISNRWEAENKNNLGGN